MAWDRWIGVAFVGLLALVAQPAAVGTATLDVATETDEPGEPTCSTVEDELPDRVTETDRVPSTPDVCLDAEDELLDEVEAVLADVEAPALG